jgi:hypothetical protein
MISALPGVRLSIFASLAWSIAMAASAAIAGAVKSWSPGGNLQMIIAVFDFGGLAGFVPALTAYRFYAADKARGQRFSLAFLALLATTLLFTWLTYLAIFRSYYAQWHDDFLTGDWLREQFFTTASSAYQFAVLGLRSFLPLGLPALFFASWLISKKPV